jgi:apolipoprotein N-acyltransferase
VALAPLFVALTRDGTLRVPFSSSRAFLLGLTTGVVYFGFALYWIPDVLVTFGGLAYPLAVLAALLLVAYLALFPAVSALLTHRFIRAFGLRAIFLAPAVCVATELIRAYALTGFPWVLLGNSQVSVLPVAQMASLFGVYGLSGLLAMWSAWLAYVVRAARRDWLIVGVVLTVLTGGLVAWGQSRIASQSLARQGTPVKVGLVQGNVEQGQKWDPMFAASIFARYLSLTHQAVRDGAHLIVWPESSTPFMFEEHAQGAEAIREIARAHGVYLLIGSDQIDRSSPATFYNAAFLVTPSGEVGGIYRKMHLVPFGEYVPLKRLLFFAAPLVESAGSFSAGQDLTLLKTDAGALTTAICYEIVFPHLTRAAVLRGAQLLSTITNDAWYGRSSAPWQHFEQARMRAIEQGRYLVRAANTGISGIVDPYGHVVARTELFEPAAALGEVRYLTALTLYARIGDAFAYACVLLSAVALIASRRRS